MSQSHKGVGKHSRRPSQIVFLSSDPTANAIIESYTSILISFQELTDFVKKAVDKIYEVNEITVIIYDSIQETHDNTDDIIDDIQDGNKSHLIHSIAQQIENAEAIKYCWNDEDNNNLYEILMKVYRDNVIDLNKYNKEIFDSNPFIERVVGIAKELNKRMRNKIEIEKIRRLLNDIDLKDVHFSNVTPAFLQQKAKKYNIKPHHATKIFNKLTEEYDDDKEYEQTDYDDIDSKERELTEQTEEMLPPTPFIMLPDTASFAGTRDRSQSSLTPHRAERRQWAVGSKCEAFSRANQQWIGAKIIKVFKDNDQEWLLVKCTDNTMVEIQRYSTNIQPSRSHKRSQTLASPLRLKAMFDQMMMQSLLHKLSKVLKDINHEIDSCHDFVYQIYHCRESRDETASKVIKFITYQHNRGMEHYKKMQRKKNAVVLLCNGSSIGQYGDRDTCDICQSAAVRDYNDLLSSLHGKLLDITEIASKWSANSTAYDQKWLLSTTRAEIVAVFTNVNMFKISTVQIAVKLYEKLIRAMKHWQEEKYDVGGDDSEEVAVKDEMEKNQPENVKCSQDIMFLWTKKNTDIATLDDIHFLFVVSVILEAFGEEFKNVEIGTILRCLHGIRMNGLMFIKIDRKVFEQSVIAHSHMYKNVELDKLRQLMECSKKLWEEIHAFDLSSIPPSSICNVSLSDTPNTHNIISDDEKKGEIEPEDVAIFEQWMFTFNSQYNRNTSFNLGMFAPLLKTYKQHRNIIIDIKYDNYCTDFNEKTYEHVLKSFISWAITLKCGNLRCEEKAKLGCHCDPNTFQLYTYNVIMAVIELKANNECALLKTLCDTNNSVSEVANVVCNILPDELQQKAYFKAYKLLVTEWINFDFYNFVCIYCRHINKSIIIDRVYEYSKSLDSCRICNKRQISRIRNNRPQFDIYKALKYKNSAIYNELYEQDSEFTLHSLNEYLSKCGVCSDDLIGFKDWLRSEEFDSDAVIKDLECEDETLNISQCVARETQFFQTANYYPLVKKFLNYHRYPTYQQGNLIRYLVLRPKFFSLLKEILLNGMYPLSISDWNDKILHEVIKQYDIKIIFATETDKRFGIEKGEPIGINHLIAIFLFVEDSFSKYRRYFTKSYYLWEKEVHCSNFYWMGRYLFESVQFFGKRFADNMTGNLYQGIHKIKSFDSIAPIFNSPILTADTEQMARKFAGQKGCTYALAPKYYGDIDNSKLLDVRVFNRRIRMLKGTKVQLRSIKIISTAENLETIVLAMQYIEKILLQTQFDVHFYHSDGLYTPKNMKTAYLLIMDCIDANKESCLTPYVRHLFDNWCFKRDFVTFETFRLEMNYMDYKLKEFLFDKPRNKINIINVKKFLPNLKHYHDINGVLRNVDLEINKAHKIRAPNANIKPDSFGLLYNCQKHDIPHHIVNALDDIHYKFDQCSGVLPEAFRMKLSKLDINVHSFYENSQYFIQQLESIGIPNVVAQNAIIQSIKSDRDHPIHSKTTTEKFIELILKRLEKEWGNVTCDLFTQKEAFKTLYSKHLKVLIAPIMKRELVTTQDLYAVAKDIDMFNNETSMKLSKYLYIKMMDDKEKIRPWTCQSCQFLNCKLMVDGLWRYYNQANKCGLCGDSRTEILNESKNSKDEETVKSRIHRRNTTAFLTSSRSLSNFETVPLIEIDDDAWDEVDGSQCTLFKSVKHLSNNQLIYLLNNYFFQQIGNQKTKLLKYKSQIVEYFANKKIDGSKFVAMNKKVFGKELKKYCGDRTLTGALLQLHKVMKECDLRKVNDLPTAVEDAQESEDYAEIISDCPALQRVGIVLLHFEQMTAKLPMTNNVYPYNIHDYFQYFPGYSPVDFLNDIDHIVKHKIKHQQSCDEGQSCIHIRRALRDRHAAHCKTIDLKKQFFHTNNQNDFVYISMLDRAHCLLKHSEDIADKMKKNIKLMQDDAVTISHHQYNTGVYMEYHTLKPLWQNLFGEIVRNEECEVTEDQFNSELEASKLFLKTDNIVNEWRACKTDSKYGIKVNEPMHIEHVLCIKFYTNYSQLCEQFRTSYRKNSVEDTTDDIIRKHCNNHYWFGRFLTTSIEFWGEIPNKSDTFYHGLSGKFVFRHFSAVYEIPTSTTWDIVVAQNFCDANGIVLKLSPKYTDEVNNSRCLDVSGLSEFQGEKEKLFAGMTVLSITNIYNPSDNEWDGYSEYVASFLYFERIIQQTNQQKQHYNHGKVRKYIQKKCLVPLIKHQMQRNGYDDDADEKEDDGQKLPKYICTLFEFFCDNKRDYIDLSCINEEIPAMHKSLQTVLFTDIKFAESSIERDGDMVREYKVNNENIKFIFPHLVEYKNHLSNWIYVGSN